MLTRQVVTHRRCNQHCVHCVARAPDDAAGFAATSSVIARIDAACDSKPEEVVLTGGEPTMRRDLASLVRRIRERGVRVVLETNATLLDDDVARSLAEAGLSLARVNLAGTDESLDRVTRDPGGFRRTTSGLGALFRAGMPVEIAIALVRGTVDAAGELPGFARSLAEKERGTLVDLVVHAPTESPDPEQLLSLDEVSAGIAKVVEAAEKESVQVRLAPDASVPPCALPRRLRGTRAGRGLGFSLARGGARGERSRHVAVCSECDVRDRCPGISERHLERGSAPSLEPIRGERARRSLTLAGTVDAQVLAELVQPSRATGGDGRAIVDAIVRVVFHCNQACRFCFVSTHLPEAGQERVARAIRDAAARGARIVLSGGEPTLSPHLVEHVRFARSVSKERITLQTNAIRCADRTLTRALREAGLDEATVSLHAARAEISDAITEAPGTFEKTLRGIDALHAEGIAVTLNHVICGRNLGELPACVRLAAERWPGVPINVSFVAASTDVVPRDHETMPRYSDARASIAEAVALAAELGVRLHGFDAMCGLPLCLGPHDPRTYLSATPIPEGFDRGEFLKTTECESCAVQSVCWGIRKGYAALHGTSELKGVTPRPAST